MSKSRYGKVTVRKPEFAEQSAGEELSLLHVPSSRHVILDEKGRRIWQQLASGQNDISSLVHQFCKEENVPVEVGSYQVISFLDELRAQELIDFELENETTSAPLLDVPLSGLPLQSFKRFVEQSQETDRENGLLVFESLREDISLRDVRQLAESMSDANISTIKRAMVVNFDTPDISLRDIQPLLTANTPDPSSLPKGTAFLDSPRLSLSIGELGSLVPDPRPTGGGVIKAPTAEARKAIVIIIITDGPIIIIVIGGGPGPSRGKSRSACKTMCV